MVRRLVIGLAAYMLIAAVAPATAQAQQSQQGSGVCRNPFSDGLNCIAREFKCTDNIDCALTWAEAALLVVAVVMLAELVFAFAVTAEAGAALATGVAETTVAEATVTAAAADVTVTAAAADVTVTAAAAEGTVITAAAEGTVITAAAEGTVVTAAAEGTVVSAAAEGTAVEATAVEATAAEATTEATAEATTELPTTLSGHGSWPAGNGVGVMPEGTYLQFASGEGQPLANSVGRVLDVGMEPPGGFSGSIGPGEVYPDYQLSPPGNLSIAGNPNVIGPGMDPVPGQPNIVSTPMNLSDILQPNMGRVFWAACRGWAGVV